MIPPLLCCLVIATLVNGVLAGINLDRYIVQVPAFRRLSIEHWVEYARLADLRTGLVWYPLLAATSLLTILVADWLYLADLSLLPGAGRPMALTTIFVAGGVISTVGAAPTLLRLRAAPSAGDSRAVFTRFHRWGLFRAACQTLAFPASLWALVRLGLGVVGVSEF